MYLWAIFSDFRTFILMTLPLPQTCMAITWAYKRLMTKKNKIKLRLKQVFFLLLLFYVYVW